VLSRAVRSIQEQTFTDWECIVVDGSRNDETQHAVEAAAAGDPRIRYFRKLEGRQGTARNFGVQHARGEIIAFTDDDDAFLPGYLAAAVQVFAEKPEVSYLSGEAIIRDDNGRDSLYKTDLEPYWEFSIGNGWVFRRKVFFEDGLSFDENLIFGEDLDLHIRCHAAGERGYIIPQPFRIYYVSAKPAQKVGGKTSGAQTQADTFEAFFTKNEKNYLAAGWAAIAWLYGYGGLVFARVGNMSRARRLLWSSFFKHPRLAIFAYAVASLLGYRFFQWFDTLKAGVMRRVRSRVNPASA